MNRDCVIVNPSMVKFAFGTSVPMPEVEATLRLAILAVQSLHGPDRVQLETNARVNRGSRSCLVDASTDVGRALALVFGGYVRREFGEEAVNLIHIPAPATASQKGANA